MEHLEHPSAELWNVRRTWFERTEEEARGDGSYLVSEQACALTADVHAVFCAGAWAGCVMLSMAVIDAALRETELPGFAGNTKDLLDEASLIGPKFQQLRVRRNGLIHVRPERPGVTVEQQWLARSSLESEARQAIRLMFEAFYLSPWV